MCNACGFFCCGYDGFSGCGCDHCPNPSCRDDDDEFYCDAVDADYPDGDLPSELQEEAELLENRKK